MSLAGKLVSTDADTAAQLLTYTLLSLPTDGVLQLNGTDLVVDDTFTQKDVVDGNVSYIHGGSEDAGDSFDWSLSDGTNSVGTTLFAITVTPTNDAPMIVNNVLNTIAEGGTTVLDEAHLSATDIENGTITYTFVSNARGQLELRIGAGPFTAMTPGQTFSQADIVAGNVRYVDPGTDDAALMMQNDTTASFSWRVDDGQGGVNPSPTGANTSMFTVTSVDDPPTSVAWRTAVCAPAGNNANINPLTGTTTAIVDVDNTQAQYEVCIVSIGTGNTVQGTGQGQTLTQLPLIIQNGVTNLAVGSCIAANVLSGINADSSAGTQAPVLSANRGIVVWRLMKGGVQVGANSNMTLPVKPATPCP